MSLDAYYNSDNLMSDGHDSWVAQQTANLSRDLVHKYGNDFDRFPLPICMEPSEELKELNLRKRRIQDIVDRMLNIAEIRFNKTYK